LLKSLFCNGTTGLCNRFEEYPKLREFILLKDEQIQKTNTPPLYAFFLLLLFSGFKFYPLTSVCELFVALM